MFAKDSYQHRTAVQKNCMLDIKYMYNGELTWLGSDHARVTWSLHCTSQKVLTNSEHKPHEGRSLILTQGFLVWVVSWSSIYHIWILVELVHFLQPTDWRKLHCNCTYCKMANSLTFSLPASQCGHMIVLHNTTTYNIPWFELCLILGQQHRTYVCTNGRAGGQGAQAPPPTCKE